MVNSYNFEVARLITQAESDKSAKVHLACQPTQEQMNVAISTALDILRTFPEASYDCALLSALWASHIRDTTSVSTYLVAGCLDFNGRRIFGDEKTITNPFSCSNPSWNGHCWVTFGNIIGDISFLRTANAERSPAWLKKMSLETFKGKGKFFVGEPETLFQEYRLRYIPKFIATDDQMTGIITPALQKFGALNN